MTEEKYIKEQDGPKEPVMIEIKKELHSNEILIKFWGPRNDDGIASNDDDTLVGDLSFIMGLVRDKLTENFPNYGNELAKHRLSHIGFDIIVDADLLDRKNYSAVRQTQREELKKND